jgi:hypothetical protein
VIGGRVLALVATAAAVGCAGSEDDGPDGRILLFDGLRVVAVSVDGGRTERLPLTPDPWATVA